MTAPPLDENLRLVERRELLAFEQLVAELGVEALAIAILPWASRFDVERLYTDPAEPTAHVASDELRAVVGSDMLRCPVRDEQISQALEDVVGAQTPRHDNRQASPGELVDDGEHPNGPPILGAILDEVIGPDMIGPLGSSCWKHAFGMMPDARSVIEPQTAAFGLLLWHFQPFPAPDPIDSLDADAPAFLDQQLADPPIAVTAILLGEPHDRLGERSLVVADLRVPALRRARLPDDSARATLRDGKLRAHVVDARSLPGRA